jgi:hypothetical protein
MTRHKLNITIAVLLGLTIFLIPFLLIGIAGHKMAITRGRRPWLWYWLVVAFPLPAILALVWAGNRPVQVDVAAAAAA